MPRNITITLEDGSVHVYQNAPDDVTPEQVTQRAMQEFGSNVVSLDGGRQQSAPQQMQTAQQPQAPKRTPFDSVARQIGLTGRYLAEGGADLLGIVANPINATVNAVAGTELKPFTEAVPSLLDRAGFPKPENRIEHNVAEASKFMVGTAGLMGGAANQAAKVVSPISKKALTNLTVAPTSQALGSAGAGYAGSEAREQGSGAGGQVVATVAGGLLAPLSVKGAQSATNAVTKGVASKLALNGADEIATNAIRKAGVELEKLPQQVQKSIIADTKEALKTGKNLSPDALRRLADYKTTGLTPMSSSLTLDPAQITQQRNLAKMSANSQDPAAQRLATLQRDNDVKLIAGLNNLGAETADDAFTAGNKIINTLNIKDEATKKVINNFYKQARETSGRSATLDSYTFTQQANNMLDDALLGGKLPNDVRKVLNSIAEGKTPLTVDVAEQYKTAIGTLQRSSTDPAERLALGKVREALDNTPLIDGQGQEAINAFNKARAANRTYMQLVERTPALAAVRDGIEPDKFVKQFIIGGGNKANVNDLKSLQGLIKDNKEAMTVVRGQIASFLKSKATGGSADEVANFSPKAYNSALDNIGEQKLKLFFSKDDIDMLKAIGRVASYEKFQPTGSAVNNSNTSSALLTAMLDKVANSPILRKIPLGGGLVANQAQEVSTAINARKALNSSNALVSQVKQPKEMKALPLGAFLGLGSVTENKRD